MLIESLSYDGVHYTTFCGLPKTTVDVSAATPSVPSQGPTRTLFTKINHILVVASDRARLPKRGWPGDEARVDVRAHVARLCRPACFAVKELMRPRLLNAPSSVYRANHEVSSPDVWKLLIWDATRQKIGLSRQGGKGMGPSVRQAPRQQTTS